MSTNALHSEAITRDRKLRRDLRTLARFVHVYCRRRHPDAIKGPVRLRDVDVERVYGCRLRLCAACGKLLAHATVKRKTCPLEPKPACKRCPTHCYAPHYRTQIREVMKYSGRHLVLRGRLDYLIHLLG